MLALAEYEAGICECGFHESLHDPTVHRYAIEDRKCTILAGTARYQRVLAEADEQAMKAHGENPPASLARPGDGRRVMIRLLPPGEGG